MKTDCKNSVRVSFSLAAAVLIVGCGNIAAESHETAWTFNVAGGVYDSFAEGGRVYLGAADGYVYALSLESGGTLWKTEIGLNVYSRPVVNRDASLIAGCRGEAFKPDTYEGGQVVSLSLEDGAIQWQTDIDATFQARVYADGEIVAASAGPYVYGIDPATGAHVWAYKHRTGMIAGVAVAAQAVVVQGADGRIQAFDPVSGEERWKASGETRSVSFPVAHGGYVFTGDLGGTLVARDVATGEPVWSIKTDGGLEGRMVVSGDLLLLTNREAEVFGIELDSGRKRWKKQYPVAGKNSSQFGGLDASETRFAFSALNKGVFVLDIGTGDERAAIPVDGALALVSVTDDMVLYSKLRGGELSAVRIGN